MKSLTGRPRSHPGYGCSQWETTLHCNVVSDWMRPYPEWTLSSNIWQAQKHDEFQSYPTVCNSKFRLFKHAQSKLPGILTRVVSRPIFFAQVIHGQHRFTLVKFKVGLSMPRNCDNMFLVADNVVMRCGCGACVIIQAWAREYKRI